MALILISIFAALSDESTDTVLEQYSGKEFSLFKKDLADLAAEKLQPISKEVTKLMSDQDYLDQIMKTGKDKAIAVAEPVLTKVYDIVGFANT